MNIISTNRLSALLFVALLSLSVFLPLNVSYANDPLATLHQRNIFDGCGMIASNNGQGSLLSCWGSNSIYHSSDGAIWQKDSNTLPLSGYWHGLRYLKDMYIAVGRTALTPSTTVCDPTGEDSYCSAACYSSNAQTWTCNNYPTHGLIPYDVAYGNNIYVAIGSMDHSQYLTSSDGVTWTVTPFNGPLAPWGGSPYLYSIAFGNGVFVAAGPEGLYESSDGLNWSRPLDYGLICDGYYNSTRAFYGVAYGNNVFVAVGFQNLLNSCGGASYGVIYTSSDGTNWTKTYGSIDPSYYYSVGFGNGMFVTIAPNGTDVIKSQDGQTWSRVTTNQTLSKFDYISNFNNTFLFAPSQYDTTGPFYQSDPLSPVRSLTVMKTGTGTGTVESSPRGINCNALASSCPPASFSQNTSVFLFATPSVGGSIFSDWSGNPDCTDGNVTMSADMSCTATFNLCSTASIAMTGSSGPFSSINAAYVSAASTDTIRIIASNQQEGDLVFTGKNLTLQGGYDCAFTEPPTFFTTISDSLTISGGEISIGEGGIQIQ